MNHAFLIGTDGYIQETYQFKSVDGEIISVLVDMRDGKEVWEDKPISEYVLQPPGEGFYKPKWTEGLWIEGLSQEEIDTLRSPPREKSEMEILKEENTLLKAQIQASSERADFHEELIAEMAMLVYS